MNTGCRRCGKEGHRVRSMSEISVESSANAVVLRLMTVLSPIIARLLAGVAAKKVWFVLKQSLLAHMYSSYHVGHKAADCDQPDTRPAMTCRRCGQEGTSGSFRNEIVAYTQVNLAQGTVSPNVTSLIPAHATSTLPEKEIPYVSLHNF